MKILRLLLLLCLFAGAAVTTRACDLCGCYAPQLNAMSQLEAAHLIPWAPGLYGAVAEQFTRFGTLQLDGAEVGNPTGQYLNSSITQVVAGYALTSRFALQINIPIIYREFKRPEGFAIDRGTVAGLGDLSILLKTVLFHYSSLGPAIVAVRRQEPRDHRARAGLHDVVSAADRIEIPNRRFQPN